MLIPSVIAYVAEPPGSAAGAKKNHAAPASARRRRVEIQLLGAIRPSPRSGEGACCLLSFDTLRQKLDGVRIAPEMRKARLAARLPNPALGGDLLVGGDDAQVQSADDRGLARCGVGARPGAGGVDACRRPGGRADLRVDVTGGEHRVERQDD